MSIYNNLLFHKTAHYKKTKTLDLIKQCDTKWNELKATEDEN